MARDAPRAVEDDEGLAMAIGLDVGMRLATRGTRDGDSDANVDEEDDDDDDDGVLRAMDRLGTRDEALLSRVGALGTRGEGEGEDEDEAKAGGETRADDATADAANAQGSRALQILKVNPQVRNAESAQMFLPAIHKSLAPKIRTEMKTSAFRPQLPAWAATKKDSLEISGDVDAVSTALDANQKFQQDISTLLRALDEKMERNERLITMVTRWRNRKGRRVHWSLREAMMDLWGQKSDLYFRVPSAWNPSSRASASLHSDDATGIMSQATLQKQITPNADMLRLGWANLVEKIPLSYASHCRAWTPKEDAQLRKGVHFQLQQARLLTDQRMSLEELAGMSVQPLSALLQPGGLDVVLRDSEAIDWGEVVRMHMPLRTVDDCRLRWMNVVDPRICPEAWTDREDDMLIELAEGWETKRNWTLIAEEIFAAKITPGKLLRSPHQCAMRYQAEWNPSLVKSSWTPEEDAFILRWIKDHGVGHWTKLARLLPGHTGQQLLHRWRRIQPTRRTGAWTEEEDEALRVAVGAYKQGERIKWSLVQEHVPTRTDVQCRERWTGVLDPGIKTGPWTEEEDAALMAAMGPHWQENGFNEWARLTAVLPGRTGKHCMRRCRALAKKQNDDGEASHQGGGERSSAAKSKNKATTTKKKRAAATTTAPVAEPALEEPVDDALGTDEHPPTARKKAPARQKTAKTTASKTASIASPKTRDDKAPVVEPEPKRPRRSTRTT
jgi:hypothetical protein